jgi:hypothetical protein
VAGRAEAAAGIARSLVLYGALADAVRRESAEAVAYWWGVTAQTVTAWRKALGVGQYNEGTRRLKSEVHAPLLDAAREASLPTLGSPERRAKIAASMKGKPRPPHVVEAVRQAHAGNKASAETRARMSQAQRARGTRPPKAGRPWTAEEDECVRELPPAEAAARTGRTPKAVHDRRRKLGLTLSVSQG